MKNKISILMFLIILTCSYSYQLRNIWLDPSNSYTLYYDQDMSNAMTDSLESNSRISFNFSSCVDSLRAQPIDNLPVIIAGNSNASGSPLLKYTNVFYDQYEVRRFLTDRAYGVTVSSIPVGAIGKSGSFTITLNDSTEFPWNINGGACYEHVGSDSFQVGGVDINTIFRHELGHVSLAHEPSIYEMDPIEGEGKDSYDAIRTLMNDGTIFYYDSFPVYQYGPQERSGFKAVYDPPLLRIKDNIGDAIEVGNSIVFEIEGPVDTRINLRSDSLFHCYLRYPYDLYPDSAGHVSLISGYEKSTEIPTKTEWVNPEVYIAKYEYTFKPDTVGTYKFKTYTAMNWNPVGDLSIYEYFPEKDRPYSEVQFRVTPQVDIQHTQNKADTYSLDAVNIFEATCTDAFGNDYPYMDEVDGPMKFYYKEAGSSGGYEEIEAPVTKATAYTRAWNSGSLKGDYIIKATAFYKEHPDSTEVFNWSDSLTIRLSFHYGIA
jgi:hypothetical protein